MNRLFHHAAFAAGLLALAWVGAGYLPGNLPAFSLVLLIGAFYLAGTAELLRFQRDTAGLAQALAGTREPPAALDAWLAALPAGLRDTVRLRLEGERAALPGPALTPYLAGLLVLLGMLGTFLGMVATLRGTGVALEQASDVAAIRASLAAPVQGLGLAFGTSVAGVAASAMLGLMSALARRERRRAGQQLDARLAGPLRGFSRARQREQALQLLQAQAETLPALVAQLQSLATQLGRQGEQLHERLLASQAQFQGEAQRAYTGLAESVDRSLQTSLAQSARLAGAAIEPAVQATLAGLASENAALQATLAAAVQRQLDGSAAQLGAGLERFGQAFDQRAEVLLRGVAEAHEALEARAAARERDHAAALREALAAQQRDLGAAFAQTAQSFATQSQAQARALLDEVARLVQAAAEAPRAAAAVIGELRSALSEALVRDNAALEERHRLLATLGQLLDAVGHAGNEQRAAIDALVQAATTMLDGAATRFAATVDAQAQVLQASAAQADAGAAGLAGLAEGFGTAVQQFGRTSEQLATQLQQIEAALGQSLARSDEQLAYYVAQAREIVDLTLGSQKQIVEDLQQVARVAARAEADAA